MDYRSCSTKVNLHKCGISQISRSTDVNPQRRDIAELWSSTNVDFHKCEISKLWSSTNQDFHKCEIPQMSSYANVNSANLDSGSNIRCYVRRCEGFAELVQEIQGVELAHRYVNIFSAYNVVVAKRCPVFIEYGLTQESQFRLHQQLGAHLSRTVSFETAYKIILFGDGRQLFSPNPEFPLEYRNDLRAAEDYAADFKVDLRFLCLEKDPKFDAAAIKGVAKGKQYRTTFFAPNRDVGYPIPLIYIEIQVSDPKTLEESQGMDKILAEARDVPTQLGIDPASHRPFNNFQKLSAYEKEASMFEAIDEGFGFGVMTRFTCVAKGFATQILDEIQHMAGELRSRGHRNSEMCGACRRC